MKRKKFCLTLLTAVVALPGGLLFPRRISPSEALEPGFHLIPVPPPGFIWPLQKKEILDLSVEHLGCEMEKETLRARVRVCNGESCEEGFLAVGQTLIITAGCGRVQRWDGPIENVHPGDVVQFAPGEKHWHGAAPTTAMSHIAIQEALDGKPVEWMEHVSDEQYLK